MSANWDKDKGGRDAWIKWLSEIMTEACRVMKPGAHALVWSLPRTSHWTAMALEDAGFECRDRLTHIFGSGFPKSQDIGKAIDKMAGAEREDMGPSPYNILRGNGNPDKVGFAQGGHLARITAPATDAAKAWDGWGSALKPSVEDWWLCRKPLSEPSIAAQVLATGTGAINIDASRIAAPDGIDGGRDFDASPLIAGRSGNKIYGQATIRDYHPNNQGRFPSHLLLSHHPACVRRGEKRVKGGNDPRRANGSKGGVSFHGYVHDERPCNHEGYADADGRELVADWECDAACPVFQLDAQAGVRKSGKPTKGTRPTTGDVYGKYAERSTVGGGDEGMVSRFFTVFPPEPFEPDPDALMYYCSKASRADREQGLEGMEARPKFRKNTSQWVTDPRHPNGGYENKPLPSRNTHPTVKSTALMRWLCRLVTPPGGTVLDMFAGSGSTGVAALLEGFSFIGIDESAEYIAIAEARLAWAANQRPTAEQLTLTV